MGTENKTQLGFRARKAGIFTRAIDSIDVANGGELKFRATKAALLEVEFAMSGAEVMTTHLTSRERKVLGFISEGFSNTKIANSMSIVEQTVKFHASNTFAKMGLGGAGHSHRSTAALSRMK